MAATLLGVPSLGVSDWSAWITLVDAHRRGFMVVSYTDFSGSVASSIATGSLVEVAGAVYSFTTTAIGYTGGPSANSDLYIFVSPDAAVSTASVVAWGSAPIWVDAKRGFYASAASTIRCIGGMYVATAGVYFNKYVYTDAAVDYCLRAGEVRPLLNKIINIGEWNMDATAFVLLYTDVLNGSVRKVSAKIINDSGNQNLDLTICTGVGTANIGGYINISDSAVGYERIRLNRITGGNFDSTDYNGTASTVANRGFVCIEYEA